MCDAQHIGSLDGNAPDRAHQDIPPSIARLVWRRDAGRCRVPGCRSARGLEIHHLVHRADGGSHEASNLCLLCSACHLAHHRGALTIDPSPTPRCSAPTWSRTEPLEPPDPSPQEVRATVHRRLATQHPCVARTSLRRSGHPLFSLSSPRTFKDPERCLGSSVRTVSGGTRAVSCARKPTGDPPRAGHGPSAGHRPAQRSHETRFERAHHRRARAAGRARVHAAER